MTTDSPDAADPELAQGSEPDGEAGEVPEPAPLPSILRVILVEALVAPVKSDGRPWDMGGAESDAAMKAVDTFTSIAATSGSPIALGVKAVTAALPAISKGAAWPDVHGEATMSPVPDGEGRIALRAHANDDPLAQLSSSSGSEASWLVQTKKRPRLRVNLVDLDAMKNDAIGVFVIGEVEFEAAWRDGGKYWVRVTEQTNNQVLAIGIIVEEVQ